MLRWRASGRQMRPAKAMRRLALASAGCELAASSNAELKLEKEEKNYRASGATSASGEPAADSASEREPS